MKQFFRSFNPRYLLASSVATLFLAILFAPLFVHAGAIVLENPLIDGIDSITEFVQLIVNTIIIPIGSVVVVMVFIYAGFLFVTAQGSEAKLKTAKNTFIWAVIGTAILLGSWVLAEVIQRTVCQIAGNTPGCAGTP